MSLFMAQASAYLIFFLLIKFSCGEYESASRARDKHNTALLCSCPSSVPTSPPVATDMKINIIVSKDLTKQKFIVTIINT